ncbi:MAG: histidine kinase, partial [Chitinophaga rupis]
PTDTGRAQLYFLLSDHWSDRDSTKALQYITDYFREGIHDDYYDGLAHFYLGGVYFEYNYLRAQQEYMTAERLLSAYTTPQAILYRSRAWHNYGVLEQKKDDSRSFIDIQLSKAIPLALQAGDTNRVAWNYKEVGIVFMNFEEYDKAREYFRRALALMYRPALHPLLYRPDADKELVADCYMDIAKAYLLNDDTMPARLPLDSAALLLASLPNSSYQPSRYLIEGMYHARAGRWQNALDSLDRGEALARGQNRTYDVFSILFEKYDVYRREKKFADARKILQQVYEFNQLMPLTSNRRLLFHELAETEAALGHDRLAYQWLQEYARLSASLAKAGTTVQIAALEARYRSSEKEKEILELHNRSKIQKLLLLGGIIL